MSLPNVRESRPALRVEINSANVVPEDVRNVYGSFALRLIFTFCASKMDASLRCGCDWKWSEETRHKYCGIGS